MFTRRRRVWLTVVLVAAGLGAAWWLTRPSQRQDWPEWPAYDASDPMTERLQPTGRDLQWSAAALRGSERFFLSNHPEMLPLTEGALWRDEASGQGELRYQVYVCHISPFAEAVYVGLLVENTGKTAFTVTGEEVTTTTVPKRAARERWYQYTRVGRRNAYAELSNTLFEPLPALEVPAGGSGRILVWKLPVGSMLGSRLRLTVRGEGPVQCRLATVWAKDSKRLAVGMPLIPRGPHEQRGTWPAAEVVVDNRDDPFDLAWSERDGEAIRCIRLCQPVYQGGKKVGFSRDVVYTQESSFNPKEARPNIGTYGARTHVELHVKNSSNRPQAVELYLRYPDKRIRGVYAGAATVYDYEGKRFTPRETRAINLGSLTFSNPLTGSEETENRWFTRALASYPVPAGGRLIIPLDVTHDYPAMLPLGIVLRKGVVNRDGQDVQDKKD
ncbi:MAG: hypothetical protein ACYDCO_03000 [Armatimonadota bacterium]